MKVSPVARTESLIVKEVDGETLVYDLKTDKAHCLNETAARVWKNCDGHNNVSEIAEVLSRESNSSVKDEVVWLALDQLEKFNLLEDAPAKPAFLVGMTRRQMVARLGIAAVALPAIISIVSPTPASAASGFSPGTCCINPADCSSNQCNQDPKNGPFCDNVGAPPGFPSTKSCA
jgi:hypothetical protein